MQFVKTLRDRVRSGEITCTVRLWQRAHVKVGGRYPLPPGHLVVTSLLEISLADVTPALARRSGFTGLVELLKVAKHGPGRRVFLIEFRYVKPGDRPPWDSEQSKRTSPP
jgi:hypothetical protein